MRGFFVKHFFVGESSMSSFVRVLLCAFLQGLLSMPSFAGLNLYAISQALYRALLSVDFYRKLSRIYDFHELFRGAFREHSYAPTSSVLYFRSGFSCALVQLDSLLALFRMNNFSARYRGDKSVRFFVGAFSMPSFARLHLFALSQGF